MSKPKPSDFVAAMADLARWSDDGVCQEEDPRLFDTMTSRNGRTLMTEDIKSAADICAGCPVMIRCLKHAVRHDIRHGVWGSMVYEERLEWAMRNCPELIPAKVLATLRMDAVIAA